MVRALSRGSFVGLVVVAAGASHARAASPGPRPPADAVNQAVLAIKETVSVIPAPAFDGTFYSTVAQVIPVLFVLVFVELGLMKRRDVPVAAAPFLLGVVTMLAGGEMVCLYALKEQKALGQLADLVISGGLLWSASLVVLAALHPITTAIATGRVGRVLLTIYFVLALSAVALVATRVIGFVEFVAVVAVTPAFAGVALRALGDIPSDVRRIRGGRASSDETTVPSATAQVPPPSSGKGLRLIVGVAVVLLLRRWKRQGPR
jgi:hypothetical protein